jgi:two-component system cell cycle sensor histidine kinase/response regulator CckA
MTSPIENVPKRSLMKLRNLESIGILAGGIAHDFNNILTALVGNIELAKLSANDKNKHLSFLDKAMAAGFKARDLANRLLTFSKGGIPKIRQSRSAGSSKKQQNYV